MTTITAEMIAHSVSPSGVEIATMQLRGPRFIHAEFMTHRMFSRNARSSRAVPVARMLEEIKNDPVVPMFWGKNEKGMQASEECNEPVVIGFGSDDYVYGTREEAWLTARDRAVELASSFNDAGYHKQVINRLLEPFMHIDVLVTSTQWSNYFALRDHYMAEPHIQVLAQRMKEAMNASTPKPLGFGEWHLPYFDKQSAEASIVADFAHDFKLDKWDVAKKLSVARCARISYTPFDGNGDIDSEIARHDMLVGATPLHASPAEHQATPDFMGQDDRWLYPNLHGNLSGWIQYRKTLSGECL